MDRIFLNKEDDESDDMDLFNKNDDENKKISNRDIIIAKLNNLFSESLPQVQGDRVIQIGCVFHSFGKKENKKYILTLGSCDKFDDDTTLLQFCNTKDYNSYNINELDEGEKQLLIQFQYLIQEEEPDILMTYNGFGFDNKFLFERAEQLNIKEQFGHLGRIDKQSEIQIKKLSSAALGDNIFYIISNMIGITELDLLQIVKRDHNLESYSLNSVSEKFIGDAKDDVTPKQIFNFNVKLVIKELLLLNIVSKIVSY